MAYVAGPVIRRGTLLDPWVRACYSVIEAAVTSTNQRAAMPHVEMVLERASPGEFSAAILGRIRKSRSVIAVFLPNDSSTPVECAFAASEGKRVLIIHQDGVFVPRLLVGLPGVETFAFEGFSQQPLLGRIRTFVDRDTART